MKQKCTRCGYSKCQSVIHIHHKDGNHSNNDQKTIDLNKAMEQFKRLGQTA